MSPIPSQTVVVTGSAGRLGRAACRELLARGWHVRAFDRCPSPAGESIVADLADATAVAAVLHGAGALVHLAATPTTTTSPPGSSPTISSASTTLSKEQRPLRCRA